MNKITRYVARSLFKISKLIGLDKLRKFTWSKFSQQGELEFHSKNEWRRSEEFEEDNRALMEYLDLKENQYSGKNIIDLGAGSKLRTAYFKNSDVYVIEPLGDKLKDLDFSDLDEAEEVYSQPGETFIEDLENKADLLISINALDHAYDVEKIIENISRYCHTDSDIILSVDIHKGDDEMHPQSLSRDMLESLFKENRLEVEEIKEGLSGDKQNYGHGTAVTYFLSKKGDN